MIIFNNVTKDYGDGTGLINASLHINSGDFVFLVGPSGAGKTTFIRLILKEIDPDSGKIVISGNDVTRLSRREIPGLRQKIGMVFQDFRLLEQKTVYENVAFAMEVLHKSRKEIRERVPYVLNLVDIQDKANRYPHELSAGEQQRVGIARALVNSPRVLICDEPTGNLDPVTAMDIMALLEKINVRGTTILMVTHAKDIVDKMNKRVVAIENGRIVRDQEGRYGFREEDGEDYTPAANSKTSFSDGLSMDYTSTAALAGDDREGNGSGTATEGGETTHRLGRRRARARARAEAPEKVEKPSVSVPPVNDVIEIPPLYDVSGTAKEEEPVQIDEEPRVAEGTDTIAFGQEDAEAVATGTGVEEAEAGETAADSAAAEAADVKVETENHSEESADTGDDTECVDVSVPVAASNFQADDSDAFDYLNISSEYLKGSAEAEISDHKYTSDYTSEINVDGGDMVSIVDSYLSEEV